MAEEEDKQETSTLAGIPKLGGTYGSYSPGIDMGSGLGGGVGGYSSQIQIQQLNLNAPADIQEPSVAIPESVPDAYLESQNMLQQYENYVTANEGFSSGLLLSFRNYNSLGSWYARNEGQEALGFTDEEMEFEDDNYNLRNHPELMIGVHNSYREELASANNYNEALAIRHRILSRTIDQRALINEGIGTQLIAGFIAVGLDPAAWLGGGLVGAVGKGAYKGLKAVQLHRTVERLKTGNTLSRGMYAAGAGVVYGAGSAATQFGTMSIYDPAVNAEIIEHEAAAGAIGGIVLAPVGMAIAGGLRGMTTARIIRAENHADFIGPRQDDRVGPVARALLWTTQAIDIPGWIGGKTPYRLFGEVNPQSAGQLFNSGHAPVSGDRISSVESFQSHSMRILKDDLDYQGYFAEFVGLKTKWYQKFKRGWQTWTDSSMHHEFQDRLHPLLHILEEGSQLPDISTMTGLARQEQILLNNAAKNFYNNSRRSLEQMADAGVESARYLLDNNIVVPRNINNYQVTLLINNRWENNLRSTANQRGVPDAYNMPIEELKKHLSKNDIDADYALGITHMEEKIKLILREQIKKEFVPTGTRNTADGYIPGGGNVGYKQQNFMWLEKLRNKSMSITEDISLQNTLASSIARSIVSHAQSVVNKSPTAQLTLEDLITKNVKKDLAKWVEQQLTDVTDAALQKQIKKELQDTFIPQGQPYGEHVLMRYLKSDEVHMNASKGHEDQRVDLNTLKQIIDNDMYGNYQSQISRRTAQTGLAKIVNVPSASKVGLRAEVGPYGEEFITSPAKYLKAMEIWKEQGGGNLPPNFFEDTWRAMMGEPTHGNWGGEALGPVARRLTSMVSLSTLGLAGIAQVSDVANVLSRGWWGKMAATDAVRQSFMRWIKQAHRFKGNQIYTDLETLMGDVVGAVNVDRTSFHADQFRSQDHLLGSGGWFREKAARVGRGVDNVQAASSRIMSKISGMNVITRYLATASQKSLIMEIDAFVRKYPTGDYSATDLGFMAQMGLTPTDIARIQNDIWPHIERFGEPIGGVQRGIKTLNLDKWDPRDFVWFGQKLEVGLGFMMGTASRGELPIRLDNPLIQLIMQNRTYSLGAHEKQLRGDIVIGAGHSFHHMGMALAVGSAAIATRELIKGGPEAVDELYNDDRGLFWRRVVSNAPSMGNLADVSSLASAPVSLIEAWADTDVANYMHFGYNRWDKGPSRGGLDGVFSQIPLYKYLSDGSKSVAGYKNSDDEDSFKIFLNDLLGLSPAPFGNSLGSILLNNTFELNEDEVWQ